MPTITAALTLPQPTVVATPARPVASAPAAVAAAAPAAAPGSTTVTLSPQAQSALAATAHPAASSAPVPPPAQATHDSSTYDALKMGLSTAAADVGDAIAGGARAVVDGVETTLSTANAAIKGTLGLPFAAVSKACDVVGSLIDEL